MVGRVSIAFLFVFTLIGSNLVFGRSVQGNQLAPKTDSLKVLLKQSQGKKRIPILWDLSDQMRRSRVDSAIVFARQALEEAQSFEDRSLQAESHRRFGRLLSINGKNPEALQHLMAAHRIYEQLQNSPKEAQTLENLGALYRRQSDYSKALEYYYAALNLKEQLADQAELVNTLKNIGVINEQLGQMKKAVNFYERALKVSKQNDDFSEIAINAVQLGNIHAAMDQNELAIQFMRQALDASKHLPGEHATASILLEMSELYKHDQSYQHALTANQEALDLAKAMRDASLQALALKNIAAVYAEQGNLRAANDHFLQAIPLFERSGRQEDMISARIQIARNYLDLGLPDKSVESASQALTVAEKTKSFVLIRNALGILINAYRQTGAFKEALSAQEKLIVVNDSIFNRTKSRQIAEMQTRYDTKKKEQDIALLQKEKERQAFLRNTFLAGLILIGIIGVLVYNRQRLKIKKNRAELENKRLKEQQLEQDLEFRNKKLTTHSLHMVQKNETMKELKENIGEILKKENGDINRDLQKLKNMVDYSFSLDKDWEEFRLYFEEVHTGFFDTLKKRYPDLTPNELRLAALAKLNLSIKETATIMGITPDSVKTARYRLRKKLDMETEENLTEYLMEIEKEEIG